MKKIIALLAFSILILVANPTAFAKSYTIDKVEIRGWVEPNGNILMNEIFTYTFDGQYSELRRAFPEKHSKKIDQFEAYIITKENPVIGEITDNILMRIPVWAEGRKLVSEIGPNSTSVSVLYKYYMRGAVKSYETYSDLDILFFDDGANHAIDFENVNISFKLPADVGEDNIHGFIHDRSGNIQKLHKDGIIFETPISKAYTETSTRVLFPSDIMTEQSKGEAPTSLDAVIAEEEKLLQSKNWKLEKIPLINKALEIVPVLFLLLTFALFFLLPQRWFLLSGDVKTVLDTDPVHLFYINKNGKWHPKNFLSGLFSLREKEIVDLSWEETAEEYKNNSYAGEKTFSFRLNKTNKELSPSEQSLVSWLFQLNPLTDEDNFHLQDAAGVNILEDSSKVRKSHFKKRKKFDKMHRQWHKEVNTSLKKAHIYTDFIPRIMKIGVLGVMGILAVTAYFIDLQSMKSLLITLLVFVLAGIVIPKKMLKKLIPLICFMFLIYLSYKITDEDLSGNVFVMTFLGIIAYYSIPHVIITSLYALRVKRGIRSFKWMIRHGLPTDLRKTDKEKWLERAYLLNRSKSKLPLGDDDLPSILTLTAMYKTGIDPFYFILQTWDWTARITSTGNFRRNRTGGGSSGGGGAGAR